MQKYTAVWNDVWMQGSHQCSVTKICRFQTDRTDVLVALDESKGIFPESVVYLFLGWPIMQGETEEPQETPPLPLDKE